MLKEFERKIMEIKAVKFTKDGFMMKSFAFGGGLTKGVISPDENNTEAVFSLKIIRDFFLD